LITLQYVHFCSKLIPDEVIKTFIFNLVNPFHSKGLIPIPSHSQTNNLFSFEGNFKIFFSFGKQTRKSNNPNLPRIVA